MNGVCTKIQPLTCRIARNWPRFFRIEFIDSNSHRRTVMCTIFKQAGFKLFHDVLIVANGISDCLVRVCDHKHSAV